MVQNTRAKLFAQQRQANFVRPVLQASPAIVTWDSIVKYQTTHDPGAGTWINTATRFDDWYLIGAIRLFWNAVTQGFQNPGNEMTIGISNDTASFYGLLKAALQEIWPYGPLQVLSDRKNMQGGGIVRVNLPNPYATYYDMDTLPSQDVRIPNRGDLAFMSVQLMTWLRNYIQKTYPNTDVD